MEGNNDIDYPCTSCGACCNHVGRALKVLFPIIRDNPDLRFPYKVNKDGICEKLQDNKCSIYDTRPTICNIDKMGKYFNLSEDDYIKKSIRSCNVLMDEDGIGNSFRINETEIK